jgi:hypothetical protein
VNVPETVSLIEDAGATFRVDGEKVLVRYPDDEQREQLTEHVASFRAHKSEVAAFPRVRSIVPTMPPQVRLLEWKLKEPSVAIETSSVVSDTALFARRTLEQLRTTLAHPKRWVGWSVPQLIDRLAQVGVNVTLESEGKLDEADQYKRNEKKATDPYQELVRAALAKVSGKAVGRAVLAVCRDTRPQRNAEPSVESAREKIYDR